MSLVPLARFRSTASAICFPIVRPHRCARSQNLSAQHLSFCCFRQLGKHTKNLQCEFLRALPEIFFFRLHSSFLIRFVSSSQFLIETRSVPAVARCYPHSPAGAGSRLPVAPLYLGGSRRARSLPRGLTGHVAHPSRSILPSSLCLPIRRRNSDRLTGKCTARPVIGRERVV